MTENGLSMVDMIDVSIMTNFHINPFLLTEEQWITAYVGVQEIHKLNTKK